VTPDPAAIRPDLAEVRARHDATLDAARPERWHAGTAAAA